MKAKGKILLLGALFVFAFILFGCTQPPVCGDGICNGNETALTCSTDCGPKPVTGLTIKIIPGSGTSHVDLDAAINGLVQVFYRDQVVTTAIVNGDLVAEFPDVNSLNQGIYNFILQGPGKDSVPPIGGSMNLAVNATPQVVDMNGITGSLLNLKVVDSNGNLLDPAQVTITRECLSYLFNVDGSIQCHTLNAPLSNYCPHDYDWCLSGNPLAAKFYVYNAQDIPNMVARYITLTLAYQGQTMDANYSPFAQGINQQYITWAPHATPLDGQRGIDPNTCFTGKYKAGPDSNTQYLWSCLGKNGGANASCSLPKQNKTWYYVSTTGNDANPGTQDKPFKTIQHAADLAKPGTIITVSPGTYAEAVDIRASGTAENLISIAGTTPTKVITNAFYVDGNYVDIENFTLTGQAIGSGGSTSSRAMLVTGSSNTVRQVIITGLSGTIGTYGITTLPGSANDVFDNVWIQNSTNIFAFTLDGNNHTITRCVIDNLSTIVGSVSGYSAFISTHGGGNGHLIDGCRITNSAFGFLFAQTGSDPANHGAITYGDNWTFRNNVFANVSLFGTPNRVSGPHTRIYNNTFYNTRNTASSSYYPLFYFASGSSGNAVGSELYNNVFVMPSNVSPIVADANTIQGKHANNYVSSDLNYSRSTTYFDLNEPGLVNGGNPNFGNLSTPDFGIYAGSVLIDKGKTLIPAFLDAIGTIRPQGSAWDIGAFESH